MNIIPVVSPLHKVFFQIVEDFGEMIDLKYLCSVVNQHIGIPFVLVVSQ